MLYEVITHFLLELGKGYAFIGRQVRFTFDDKHFSRITSYNVCYTKLLRLLNIFLFWVIRKITINFMGEFYKNTYRTFYLINNNS